MVVETTGKQKGNHKKWKCFHCGQVGHRAADCSSGSRTTEGQEAFQSFLNRRTELAHPDNDNEHPQQSQQSPLHHYHRLVAWMQLQQSSLASPILILCDPIRLLPQLLRPVAADHDPHDPDHITTTSTLPKSLAKDIHHSYREIFHMTME
eukprot:scaffold17555_cov48-Attheya_sp.AAC.1